MKEPGYSVFDDGRIVFRYGQLQQEAPFAVEVRCLIKSRLHEKHSEIMEQHRQWARGFRIPPSAGKYQRYCDTRLDLLSSYQCYDLPLEAAVIHSHLMTWFFVFDDMMDIDHGLKPEERSYTSWICKRHVEILNGAHADDKDPGVILAFYDLLQKVRKLSEERFADWYERMKRHLEEYVLGAHWESLIGPTTGINTNTAMYLQVRHMAVGVAPCLDLMAIAAGIAGIRIADNSFIQRLERLAINYSIWVNDLAGLRRDIKRGLGNVIFTLQRDHSLTLAEATRMVARMCDGELEAFLTVERQLPMLVGDEHETDRIARFAYIDVLKRWMRGLLDWSARSDRYQRGDVDMALQNDALIRQASLEYPAD